MDIKIKNEHFNLKYGMFLIKHVNKMSNLIKNIIKTSNIIKNEIKTSNLNVFKPHF